MEETLRKVRLQSKSGLENQKQASILLTAVEETIREQGEELSPIAYFGTLMTIIEQTTENDTELVISATYLLSIVFSHVSVSVLKLKFADIATLYEKLLLSYQDQAPVVRSVVGCVETLLCAQDNTTWTKDPQSRKLLQDLLSMCLDARPKVRKRATDAVRKILASPPPPSFSHPGTVYAIDFCLMVLENIGQGKMNKQKDGQLMDTLVFLKVLIPVFSTQSKNEKIGQKLAELVQLLLALPVRSSAGNTVLTQWVFIVLNTLLTNEQDQKLDFAVVTSVVSSLIEMSPYENDAILTPAWLEIMVSGFAKLASFVSECEQHKVDLYENQEGFAADEYPTLLTSFFKKIFSTFISGGKTIKSKIMENATTLLAALFEIGVSNSMIKTKNVSEMIGLVQNALVDIHSRDNWGHLLTISAAIFNRFGKNNPELTFDILKAIMEFRDDKAFASSFPFKIELESALFAAVQQLGIKNILQIAPLNVEVEGPKHIRRPYLLSIFASALAKPATRSLWDNTTILGSQEFGFYVSDLLPVAERMFKKAGTLWTEERQLEAKVFETIGLQIWSLFPLISTTLPMDVPKSFGLLAPYLGKALTTEPDALYPSLPSNLDLRPMVCQGLESLIETFLELSKVQVNESDDSITLQFKRNCQASGEAAIKKLNAYVNRFLSALCNIYTSIDLAKLSKNKTTGQALQVIHEKSIQYYEKPIRKFLLIAGKKAILDYSKTLNANIVHNMNSFEAIEVKLSTYSMIDLLLILIPFLELPEQIEPVFSLYKFCCDQIGTTDNTLQKKVYKGLNAVFDLLSVEDVDLESLLESMVQEEVVSNVSHGAAKARVKLIEKIVVSTNDKNLLLKYVPQFLPEVMLNTKEASEKSREVAYECLISLAKKMMTGLDAEYLAKTIGSKMDSMALDEAKQDINESGEHIGEISIREFMLMVLAGLAGASSHMQSASIASLGRLLFEFSDALDPEMVGELIKTVLLCFRMKNREVTKAALGFLKVTIVCVNHDLLEIHLQSIISTILEHSQDFKAHFKSKIRHIFERLIRKFSFEKVDEYFPESDKKLIQNIKKRKESLKRRKAAARNNDEVDQAETKPESKAKFEEAFHDSGSELDSDGDDNYIPEQFKEEKGPSRQKKNEMVIREGDTVDFLDSKVVGQVANTRNQKKSKKVDYQPATNEEGMLIIDESDDEMEEEKPEISEDYYKQSLASEVAFTRTADGKVKFLNKKKRSADDGEPDGDPTVGNRWNESKKKSKAIDNKEMNKMLGRQFKAKKAGGDVKKAGMDDPYAYIPLTGKIVGNMKKSTKIDGTLKNILKAAHKGTEIGVKARKHKGMSKGNKKHNK